MEEDEGVQPLTPKHCHVGSTDNPDGVLLWTVCGGGLGHRVQQEADEVDYIVGGQLEWVGASDHAVACGAGLGWNGRRRAGWAALR